MTSAYEISFADLQDQAVARVRGRISFDEIPTFLGKAFADTAHVVAEQGLHLLGPPYARYRLTQDGVLDVEAGFPVSGPVWASGRVAADTLAGGHVATTLHVGAYDDVAAAYEALEDSVTGHGCEPTGAAWEVYLDRPDVAAPRTRVYQPCRRVRPRSGRSTPAVAAGVPSPGVSGS